MSKQELIRRVNNLEETVLDLLVVAKALSPVYEDWQTRQAVRPTRRKK